MKKRIVRNEKYQPIWLRGRSRVKHCLTAVFKMPPRAAASGFGRYVPISRNSVSIAVKI